QLVVVALDPHAAAEHRPLPNPESRDCSPRRSDSPPPGPGRRARAGHDGPGAGLRASVAVRRGLAGRNSDDGATPEGLPGRVHGVSGPRPAAGAPADVPDPGAGPRNAGGARPTLDQSRRRVSAMTVASRTKSSRL